MIGSNDIHRLGDEELMELLADGDPRAFEAIYDRHGGPAFSLAYRVVGTRAAAEDIVQEAFLAIWRSADGYRRERAKPSTWILTLVHRRAVDLVRREDLRRAEQLGVPLGTIKSRMFAGLTRLRELVPE